MPSRATPRRTAKSGPHLGPSIHQKTKTAAQMGFARHRYTTSEGITIPVTAPQREIALCNLEEQGLARPLQYDDAEATAEMMDGGGEAAAGGDAGET